MNDVTSVLSRSMHALPALIILVLTPGPVVVRDAVTSEASLCVLLHQTEGVIETGIILALLHPVLTHSP